MTISGSSGVKACIRHQEHVELLLSEDEQIERIHHGYLVIIIHSEFNLN